MVPGVTTVDAADSGTFDAVLTLYVGCAKLADGRLDESEGKRILELARKHSGGLGSAYAVQALRDVVHMMAGARTTEAQLERVVDAAERVAERLDADTKAGIVGELKSIAQADGENTEAEMDFVAAVAKTLGVS